MNKQNMVAGSIVPFGTYPQTARGTDRTPIEWQVLARVGDKALLLSRYGLEEQPYHDAYEYVTWSTCSLRKWLNDTFLHNAFTPAEKRAILTTYVSNDLTQGYRCWAAKGGFPTQDKVFLLSLGEANQYLGVAYRYTTSAQKETYKYLGVNFDTNPNTAACAYPTEYLMTKWNWPTKNSVARWWLRSPGQYQSYAAYIGYDGALQCDTVNEVSICVRPAMWVDLSAVDF